MASRKGRMRLGAFFNPTGHHVASWRHPDAQAAAGVVDAVDVRRDTGRAVAERGGDGGRAQQPGLARARRTGHEHVAGGRQVEAPLGRPRGPGPAQTGGFPAGLHMCEMASGAFHSQSEFPGGAWV